MNYSEQMNSVISKLRRRISDTDTPPTFEDELLYGYIADAVDELEGGAYPIGLTVSDGEFSREINGFDENIYAIQAAIIFTQGTKSRADRDNFSLKKQNLGFDTSGQSSDHAETLRLLTEELDKRIYRALISGEGSAFGSGQGVAGYRVE